MECWNYMEILNLNPLDPTVEKDYQLVGKHEYGYIVAVCPSLFFKGSSNSIPRYTRDVDTWKFYGNAWIVLQWRAGEIAGPVCKIQRD